MVSESGNTAVDELASPPPQSASAGRLDSTDLRFAALVVVALAVLGAALGAAWAAWSPPGPRAYVLAPGVFFPDETEAFVAGDGRFMVLGALAGLAGGIGAWLAVARRGSLTALALVAGGLAGSALMELVGHVAGGGSFAGQPGEILPQLPLSLHAQGLLLVEPAVAALVYGLLVAFTADDDLGRPDPVRAALARRSVGAGGHPHDSGGDGDAASVPQQRDLPPQ